MFADTPVRRGELELLGTWSPSTGLTGRVEARYRPLENLAAIAFGEINSRTGPVAGAGVQIRF